MSTTVEQRQCWARVATAAFSIGRMHRAGSGQGAANAELFQARPSPPSSPACRCAIAEATRAGWPELDLGEGRCSVQGYLDRHAHPDGDRLHGTLSDLAHGRGS